MKKLFWPIISAILAVTVVAILLNSGGKPDTDVEVHVYDASPKIVGEYDCVVYAPERFGDAFQVEAAPGCKSFKVLTGAPPRRGKEPCHVAITRVNIPLVEPPALMPLGTLNPFQGKGCKRAVWSVRQGFILNLDENATTLTADYVNMGSIKVKQPPRVDELPLDPEGHTS